MAQVRFFPKHQPRGENLRQRLEQGPLFFPSTPPHLEVEEIHPTLEESPIVGDLGLDIFGRGTAFPQLVEVDLV